MMRQVNVPFVFVLTTTFWASAFGQEWIQNDIDRSDGIREFQRRFNSASEHSRDSFTVELIQRWHDDEHPMRIIGAIEGKTGVRVPDGWSAGVVLKLGTHGPVRDKFIHRGVLSSNDEYILFHRIRKPTLVRDDVFPSSIRHRKTVRLSHRAQAWSIETDRWRLETQPFPEWKPSRSRHWQINVSHGTRPIVALSDGWGSAFHIRSFETGTGKEQWVAPVWGLRSTSPVIYTGGPPVHAVWIMASETAVVVFGLDGDGDELYAEAFDAKSGKAIFRFSPEWGIKIDKR